MIDLSLVLDRLGVDYNIEETRYKRIYKTKHGYFSSSIKCVYYGVYDQDDYTRLDTYANGSLEEWAADCLQEYMGLQSKLDAGLLLFY